ncbi:hypothetical protein DFH08DRAFT_237691 [Mycena albidolilacea]|uniref:Uncharacterized protein n=1 Tax=Mycena albidolilacea TaxID=1033008 RepID=A0AAD7EPB3_9AGAR|nr:hypothetical protein DFH08DRAFT_237691 [Mycena albidolilacea]
MDWSGLDGCGLCAAAIYLPPQDETRHGMRDLHLFLFEVCASLGKGGNGRESSRARREREERCGCWCWCRCDAARCSLPSDACGDNASQRRALGTPPEDDTGAALRVKAGGSGCGAGVAGAAPESAGVENRGAGEGGRDGTQGAGRIGLGADRLEMRDTATAVVGRAGGDDARARAAGGPVGGAIEGADAGGGGQERRGRKRKLIRIVCARRRA